MGGVGLSGQALETLRGQVADIIIGSIFLFVGLAACAIAGIRRRSGTRIFAWLGIWSAMYGTVLLSQSQPVLAVSPRWVQISAPYANTAMMYLLVVVGSLAFLELSLGRLRLLLQGAAFVGLAIAVAGIAFFVFAGSKDKLIIYDSLLAACFLVVLATVIAVPGLSSKYLVLPNRGVLAIGTHSFSPLKPCLIACRTRWDSTPRASWTTSDSQSYSSRLAMSLSS